MKLKNNFNHKEILKAFHGCKEKIALTCIHRKKMVIAGAAVIVVAVVALASVVTMKPEAYMLTVKDVPFAYIQSPTVVEEALKDIKTNVVETKGIKEVLFDETALKYTAIKDLKKDANILSKEELSEKLLLTKLLTANAWNISINGNGVLATATEEDAKKVLDAIIAHYQTSGSEIVSTVYKENVGIVQQIVPIANILNVEDGVNLLLTGSAEPKNYVVRDGDTLWDIAKANNMTTDQLQEMNPGFDPNKIKIGQSLNLVYMHPYITILTKERVTKTENIKFDTVFENTNTLYKGQVKVKKTGVYGKKEIVTEIVKENGVQTSAIELSTTILSKPEAQIAYKGTKSLATFVGSGSFVNPVPVHVSSPFGSRGSSRHTGVDLRNPKGTPIKVADDGVVTFSGYSGTYGNIVKVSHGNGIETRYAHCDSLLVSVGERVSKGQQIATVGITGRATGYHLHFEVRKNGVPQNPMNYL